MIALSQPTTITVSVVGLFALLAIIVLVRSLLTRGTPSSWRRYRFGFFIERDPRDDPPR